VKQMSFI